MSTTKLRKAPIAEQIAYYEEQIKCIDAKIAKEIAQKKELQRRIHRLQKPDAEEKHRKRVTQSMNAQWANKLKETEAARRRERIEREIEECLRINGKL